MRADFTAPAELGCRLARTSDYRTALSLVAQLAVPGLADAAVVVTCDQPGLNAIEVAHLDPARRQELAAALASAHAKELLARLWAPRLLPPLEESPLDERPLASTLW